MQRSRKVLVVSHCLLNANAKVFPLATCPGVCMHALTERLSRGEGLLQLPCPETAFLGMKRFGMTREQYDHPAFRRFCRQLLGSSLDQLEAYATVGYELTGIVGVDGSPNCGITTTCFGYRGGEIALQEADLPEQLKGVRLEGGQGIFMQEFFHLLGQRDLRIPRFFVNEESPTTLHAAGP